MERFSNFLELLEANFQDFEITMESKMGFAVVNLQKEDQLHVQIIQGNRGWVMYSLEDMGGYNVMAFLKLLYKVIRRVQPKVPLFVRHLDKYEKINRLLDLKVCVFQDQADPDEADLVLRPKGGETFSLVLGGGRVVGLKDSSLHFHLDDLTYASEMRQALRDLRILTEKMELYERTFT